jgi:hypothetical protein
MAKQTANKTRAKKRKSKRPLLSVRVGYVDADGNMIDDGPKQKGPGYLEQAKAAGTLLRAVESIDPFQAGVNKLHDAPHPWEEEHRQKLSMLIDHVRDELPPLTAEHEAVIVRLIAAGFSYAATQAMKNKDRDEAYSTLERCNRGLMVSDDNENAKDERWQAIRELAPKFLDKLTGKVDMKGLVRQCIADRLGNESTVYKATEDLRDTYAAKRKKAKASKPRQRR